MKTLLKLILMASLGLAGAAWLYGSPWSKPGFTSGSAGPSVEPTAEPRPTVSEPRPAVEGEAAPSPPSTADKSNAEYNLSSEGYRGIVAPQSGSVFNPLGPPPARSP